jgi:hypothetical protein
LEDEELDRLRDHYERIAEHARRDLRARIHDTVAREVEEEETS